MRFVLFVCFVLCKSPAGSGTRLLYVFSLHKPSGSAHQGRKEAGPPALALSPQGEWNAYFMLFNFGESLPLSLPF